MVEDNAEYVTTGTTFSGANNPYLPPIALISCYSGAAKHLLPPAAHISYAAGQYHHSRTPVNLKKS